MATLVKGLLAQIKKLKLLHRVDDIVSTFDGDSYVGALVHLHAEAFEDVIRYMDQHINMYIIMFEGDEIIWVPGDCIKYIFKGDKNLNSSWQGS